MSINLSSLPSWVTTVAGIMIAIPAMVAACPGLTLSPTWQHVLYFIGAIGALALGTAAKGTGSHSTQQQVNAATAEEKK